MLMGQPRPRFGHGTSDERWPAWVAAIGLTGGLFAAALGSMRALPEWADRTLHDSTRPVVVELPSLPMPVPPRTVPQAVPRTTPRARPPAAAAPTGLTPEHSVPTPVGTPTAPTLPATPTSTAPRDSTAIVQSLLHPERPASENALVTLPAGRGAPVAPAGVTIHDAPIPARVLDSIAQAKLAETAELALMRKTAHEDTQRLEESQRQSALLQRRTTTSGNARDLAVLQGKGVDGVGAVGGPGSGVMSFGLPLFSSGPSAAQRKKNEQLDAEYQLRLRRLQDRIRIARDSARADSLRRDSLARTRRRPEDRR